MFASAVCEKCAEYFTNCNSQKEEFMNQGNNKNELKLLVYLFLMLLLVLFVGKFLWNEVAVKLISGLKPCRSVIHILGLVILLDLLLPKNLVLVGMKY